MEKLFRNFILKTYFHRFNRLVPFQVMLCHFHSCVIVGVMLSDLHPANQVTQDLFSSVGMDERCDRLIDFLEAVVEKFGKLKLALVLLRTN